MVSLSIKGKRLNIVQLISLIVSGISILASIAYIAVAVTNNNYGALGFFVAIVVIALMFAVVVQSIMAVCIYVNNKACSIIWMLYGPVYFTIVITVGIDLLNMWGLKIFDSNNSSVWGLVASILAFMVLVIIFVLNYIDSEKQIIRISNSSSL